MSVEQYFDKHGLLQLTGESITIHGQEGFAFITIKVMSGTIDVTGETGMTIGGKACGTVTFPNGTDFTFGTGTSTVDNLTIDATGGSVIVSGVTILNPA